VVGLLRARDPVDWASLGFTAVDQEAEFKLVTHAQPGFDAMLSVDGRTERMIAFRRRPSGFEWIGEQESFQGPGTFQSADGTFPEEIVITYTKDRLWASGIPLDKPHIEYHGNDARLTDPSWPGWPHRRGLSIEAVKPVLAGWGF
jgi:hypothetical protein